ncbi:GGDEF domain-containing protein [soil metagenome]
MLSVPTLWTVFTTNFLAVGLIWAYVARSYPSFVAARYWTVTALLGALGAASGLLRGSGIIESRAPVLFAALIMILGGCFAVMGVWRFYGRPVTWRLPVITVGLSAAGIAFFSLVYDSLALRIVVYSLGQAVPTLLMLRLLLRAPADGRSNPGARLAGYVSVLMVAAFAVRPVATLLGVGGAVDFLHFNELQAVLVLILVFLSMAWNFGFLMMAIDALRTEVADLALLDDLTGVANRRHFLQRLEEECAVSLRSQKPFALLAIDLDGFKEINDGHGHAAGDDCLRHFTLMVQARLRPGDMLARTGGDEFCIVLPATTLMEGALIAHRVLDACREDAAGCVAGEIPIAASIGVAEWSPRIGTYAERLMAAADQALYAAKNDGKNRCALFDPAPDLAPAGLDPAVSPAGLRRTA